MLIVVCGAVGVLLLLAGLHAYWGVGGYWPGTDERSMVEHVVGRTEGMRAPGMSASFAVAMALVICAGLAGVGGGLVSVSGPLVWVVRIGLAGAAAVFVLRGAAGYVPLAFRYAEGTPFHHLNRVFYSPLCLLIGAALLLIVWKARA